ncbi:MAG: glycosyltransferase family 1 protein [Candidatus Hydrogenedentota bacterium]
MSEEPLRVALDLSCALEGPLTGVGYAAWRQAHALASLEAPLDLRLFATRARGGAIPEDLRRNFTRCFATPCARRLKLFLWTRYNWPPLEWFCGEADIAHGMFHGLPAARNAKRMATIHDLVVFRYPETHTVSTVRTHQRLLIHAARYADALIAVSESCRQDVMGLLDVPPDKVFVVPNGVCLEEFEGELDSSALAHCKERLGVASDYWLYIGTIEPRKNLCRLLEAYRRVMERFPECPDLLLAGRRGWYADPVFKAISDLRLEEKVKHAGYLPRSDVILLLRGAAGCLYPSLYEGFGLPVLEAMAARVPVLTSNVSALPEVIGPYGVLINPEDVDELESGLETLLTRSEMCAQMVEQAYERAQGFTWESSAKRLMEVYEIVQRR